MLPELGSLSALQISTANSAARPAADSSAVDSTAFSNALKLAGSEAPIQAQPTSAPPAAPGIPGAPGTPGTPGNSPAAEFQIAPSAELGLNVAGGSQSISPQLAAQISPEAVAILALNAARLLRFDAPHDLNPNAAGQAAQVPTPTPRVLPSLLPFEVGNQGPVPNPAFEQSIRSQLQSAPQTAFPLVLPSLADDSSLFVLNAPVAEVGTDQFAATIEQTGSSSTSGNAIPAFSLVPIPQLPSLQALAKSAAAQSAKLNGPDTESEQSQAAASLPTQSFPGERLPDLPSLQAIESFGNPSRPQTSSTNTRRSLAVSAFYANLSAGSEGSAIGNSATGAATTGAATTGAATTGAVSTNAATSAAQFVIDQTTNSAGQSSNSVQQRTSQGTAASTSSNSATVPSSTSVLSRADTAQSAATDSANSVAQQAQAAATTSSNVAVTTTTTDPQTTGGESTGTNGGAGGATSNAQAEDASQSTTTNGAQPRVETGSPLVSTQDSEPSRLDQSAQSTAAENRANGVGLASTKPANSGESTNDSTLANATTQATSATSLPATESESETNSETSSSANNATAGRNARSGEANAVPASTQQNATLNQSASGLPDQQAASQSQSQTSAAAAAGAANQNASALTPNSSGAERQFASASRRAPTAGQTSDASSTEDSSTEATASDAEATSRTVSPLTNLVSTQAPSSTQDSPGRNDRQSDKPTVVESATTADATVNETAIDPSLTDSQSTAAPSETDATINFTQMLAAREARSARAHQQVTNAINEAAQQGDHLRIMLTPPELGEMSVDLVRTETGIVARLEFSNAVGHRAVQQALPELQQSLQQSGIRIDRIELQLIDPQRAGERPAEAPRQDAPQGEQPDSQQRQQRQQRSQQERREPEQAAEDDDEKQAA